MKYNNFNLIPDISLNRFKWIIILFIIFEILILSFVFTKGKVLLLGIGLISIFNLFLIILNPEIGIILCIAIQFSRVVEGLIFLGNITGVYRLLFLLTIFAGTLKFFISDHPLQTAKDKLFLISMLFIGLFIFSNVYAYDVKYAYERTLVYFRAWTFLAAIALFLRSWKALFYSLLFSIGLSVLSNVFLSYNYLKDPELLAMVALKGDILRAKGFIFDPNYAALSSIVVIPLVLPFFKKANSKIIKIILLICLLVFIFSIFLTFSRMGVIVLALLGAYFLFKERSNRWVWITIAILTIFVIFWLPDMFFTRISNLFSGKLDDSLVQRIRILKGGFKMFLDHPIKGVGIGNFAYLSQNYIPEVSKERYAHNLYLETVAELGIIGFFVFLFMIWQTLTYLWNIQKVSKKVCQDLYYTAYALELSFIGFLVGSIFLSTMHSTYLWGLIGIVIALKSISDKAMPLENNHTIHS